MGASVKKHRQLYKPGDTFNDRVLTQVEGKSSQYRSEVYERLKETGRLKTFLNLVSSASAMGLTRTEACRHINKYMKEFFGDSGIGQNTFKMMLERYPDINNAWAVNRDNIAGLAAARIYELIANSSDIELLLKIAKEFDNSGIVHEKDRSTWVPTKRVITVQSGEGKREEEGKYGDSEETQFSLSQLRESLEALDSEADEEDGTNEQNVKASD